MIAKPSVLVAFRLEKTVEFAGINLDIFETEKGIHGS
jgi:hypothetical protein